MAYNLLLAPRAKQAFSDAVAYIAVSLGSPKAAANLANSFESSLDDLAANPFAYPIDHKVTELVGRETRRKRVGSYRLYFHASKRLNTVEIAYFFHCRQNVMRHIGHSA